MVPRTQQNRNFANNLENIGESFVWHEICGHNDEKDVMQTLDLEETVDQLAKVNSVFWY